MAVLTCRSCGNTDSFVHKEISYERVYYQDGEACDYKSLDVESSTPVSCWECNSENIGEA
jgi:hypothetical protein